MSGSHELSRYHQYQQAEQQIVQADKLQGRSADEYTRYFFRRTYPTQTSEVEEFLQERIDGSVTNLEGILRALYNAQQRTIHWVDMGGGRGLAMRQLALQPEIKRQTQMTNVDLFDYDLLSYEVLVLAEKFPHIKSDEVKPTFIQANVETIQLSKPVDLITSVEVMQYLDHPLATICNWYNSLTDGGIVLISTSHKWSGDVRYVGTVFEDEPHPSYDMLKIFQQNAIPFAVSDESYYPDSKVQKHIENPYRVLAIQKIPHTYLIPSSPVRVMWYNFNNYKAVCYDPHLSPIQVIHQDAPPLLHKRYIDQLSNVIRNGSVIDQK